MGNDFYESENSTLREIVGKIDAMDDRIRGLIRYSEYIAASLDASVDYTEFIGKQLTSRFDSGNLKRTEDNPGHRTPSFKQFRKMRSRS